MSLADRVVGISELALALGRSEQWIKRQWLNLHMEEGMPRKLPTNWVWPRKAMENWIEQQGAVFSQESADQATPVNPDLKIITFSENQKLRERYSKARAI